MLTAIYNANIDADGQWIDTGGPSDLALVALAKKQGFDAHPHVLSSEQFDKAVADDGHTVVYRGLKGAGGKSAADLHDQTRGGAYEPGFGVFGNGYYMAPGRDKAESFSDGTVGSVGRYALDAKARTITYTELDNDFFKYFKSPSWQTDPVEVRGMHGDFGRYALARGFDAIRIPAGTPLAAGGGLVQREEFVILNRGALLADRGGS